MMLFIKIICLIVGLIFLFAFCFVMWCLFAIAQYIDESQEMGDILGPDDEFKN